jgi:ABC-type bacteriocin/lantibiotic exporter with double-glycine peptidase domain
MPCLVNIITPIFCAVMIYIIFGLKEKLALILIASSVLSVISGIIQKDCNSQYKKKLTYGTCSD